MQPSCDSILWSHVRYLHFEQAVLICCLSNKACGWLAAGYNTWSGSTVSMFVKRMQTFLACCTSSTTLAWQLSGRMDWPQTQQHQSHSIWAWSYWLWSGHTVFEVNTICLMGLTSCPSRVLVSTRFFNGAFSMHRCESNQQTAGLLPDNSRWKNMVARIYTTVCFWHQRVKTPHVLSFFKSAISSRDDEKFAEFFFHLASARYVSLGHVVAIDPLIDSIPESSIDCWASAVLHLTGAIFLRCCQQRSIYVGFLQLSFFPALAPSESIHYACGPRTSPPCFW